MLLVLYCLNFIHVIVFFQQNTEDGMRISDWSSDVCSSDLVRPPVVLVGHGAAAASAEEAPDAGRGGIGQGNLAGEAEGAARHAEEGGHRGGGVAAAAFAVAIGAPVLRALEFVGDVAAKAASARGRQIGRAHV